MNSEKSMEKRIFTIPNILSAFRLVLIPVFVWTYYTRHAYLLTAGILLLSGLTDLADGFIARHFHMISNLGKMLDPIADKLTQLAILFCLVTRFPMMWIPLIIFAVKEISVGITFLLMMRKSGAVTGADWHGKVTTTLLDIMVIVHLIWFDIPNTASNVMIAACSAMMLLSWGLYVWNNVRFLMKR